MAAIAFVGDSFCATYHYTRRETHDKPVHENKTESPTYLDIVAERHNMQLYCYGYGGKSWWFSRCHFLEELHKIPSEFFADQLEVIVFCHTDPSRFNNSWNIPLDNSDYEDADLQYYYRHLFDEPFHEWAQQQWFREIASMWGSIKTVHFHCFRNTVQWSHLLPGVVVTTPLVQISAGELEGSRREIDLQMRKDTRANHLSQRNNEVLGEWLAQAIADYRPGHYELPLAQFEQNNPRAHHWPSPDYDNLS